MKNDFGIFSKLLTMRFKDFQPKIFFFLKFQSKTKFRSEFEIFVENLNFTQNLTVQFLELRLK